MPTALVTGATGLVGMHLVQRLQRDGWKVRALVRDAARAGSLSRADVTLATGDVLEPTGFAIAARKCDVLFHTAAVITPRGGWEAFRRPNVEGTKNAIAAAASAKARLVHVSSVAVYGASERYSADGRLTDESAPPGNIPASSFYARSKRESEDLVFEAQRSGALWATVVRPCVVYGPYDRQFVPRLARMLRRGFVPVIAGGQTTMPIVHAGNVVDGMVRAAESDGANGNAYNLANDFEVTVADFFRYAAEGMETSIRIVSVPMLAARIAVGAFQVVAPLVVGDRFNSVTSATLDFIARNHPFSSERARRELGWDPQIRPEQGVVEAFRWWAAHH
ncbi:MAG: NAD-dependent epimerase/dehydratase family protein [bacterium]